MATTTAPIIFDVECYKNYFLVVFLDSETGEWTYWERHNDIERWPLIIPYGRTLIGFNSKNYDLPVLSAAALGTSNRKLKEIGDSIIVGRVMWWQHSHDTLEDHIDHIDIIQVMPGTASLKIYGGRLGYPKLMDLPIDPSATISYEQAKELKRYCRIDCDLTNVEYKAVKKQIDLRTDMMLDYEGLDFRSKSDAQIAEAILVNEVETLTNSKVVKPSSTALIGKAFSYNPPEFIQFHSDVFKDLLTEIQNTEFIIGSKGAITLPDSLANKVVQFGDMKYKLGIGGLHSVDKPGHFHANETMDLVDIDVTSYYPSLILACGYYPEQMTEAFLPVYKGIVEKRVAAKQAGDTVTANALKIVANGTFGKLGSRYSKLYSPATLIHVTLTGQLALLMLIEKFPQCVVSANTDGITATLMKRERPVVEKFVKDWEVETGMNMEWSEYKSYYRRDVNNYLVIKPDLTTKAKGIFTTGGLMKNPVNEVITKAVIDHLVNGSNVEQFIRQHTIVKDFTSLRTVKGGAIKNGIRYGKSVRWYWSTREHTSIKYQVSGNVVPTTENSRMMMDLVDTVPDDVDYQRYINEAYKLLRAIT